jgi:Holliday junction resolvase RusA-like endonuclease
MFINNPNTKGRGRIIAPHYRAWKEDVAKRLHGVVTAPLERPYGVLIRLNISHQSDIDNRTKAVLDALVNAGVICGDQWIDDCRSIRDLSVDECEVEVWSIGAGS